MDIGKPGQVCCVKFNFVGTVLGLDDGFNLLPSEPLRQIYPYFRILVISTLALRNNLSDPDRRFIR